MSIKMRHNRNILHYCIVVHRKAEVDDAVGEGRRSSGSSFERSAHLLAVSRQKGIFEHNSGKTLLYTSFSRFFI